MAKVLLIGDLSSAHTIRWIGEYEMQFGISEVDLLDFRYNNACLIRAKTSFHPKRNKFYSIAKLFFYLLRNRSEYSYVHAFYATTYGLFLKVPFNAKKILSIWGSDILLFPKKSFVHKVYTKFLLYGSPVLYATSQTLKRETQNYTRKNISVVPYGIDFGLNYREYRDDCKVKVGFVKKLDWVYNQELMLRVFDEINLELEHLQVEFHIYGDGPLRSKLEHIRNDLVARGDIFFHGNIGHHEIETAYSELDIVLNVSFSESFGVSVLESLNFGCAVIVSDIPAFKELLEYRETDEFFVDPYSKSELKSVLKKYITDSNVRRAQVKDLRSRIVPRYNWSDNVNMFFNTIHK